jgi:hypothetical protein
MSTVVNLASLGSAGFIIQGDISGDDAGYSVSGTGDINGDGFEDIIIGAPYNDGGGNAAGAAYVIYGHAGGFANIDLTNLSAAAGFRIQGHNSGTTRDYAGLSVSDAGDVNGDGFDDIMVASVRGGFYTGTVRAYVIFGGPTRSTTLDLGAFTTSDGFLITGLSDSAYYKGGSVAVSSAGDMNGDGFDDVIVSSTYGGSNGTGLAYVVFGKASGFGTNGVVDLAHLPATDGFAIVGEPQKYIGHSVSSLGDINGDGFDDIIVGEPGGNASAGQAGTGLAFVIFGHPGTFGTIQLADIPNFPAAGFVIQGDAAGDEAGFSVSGAGDINGDGLDDIIVGAAFGDNGGTDAGEAYVIFGRANGFGTIDLTNLTASAGFIIQGDAANDEAGFSVSSAGDVNHDGFDDLILGAITNDAGLTNAGRSYVIFGHAGGFSNIDLTNLDPAAGFVIQGAAVDDVSGWSVSGAGDINGDGADDLLVGAPFGDLGGTNAGQAYVVSGTNTGGTARDVDNDFNGDGRSDILWRHDDGRLTDWLGTAAGGYLTNAPNSLYSVTTDWQVAGTGDFDGDGRDDILWRNTDGRITNWLGAGAGGFFDNVAQGFNAVTLDWQIAGVGDFDGDGRDDILWRNADGRLTDWLGTANGGYRPNSANLMQNVSTQWSVAATGDFNGDGRDDILWRNADGRITDWLGTATGGFSDNAANGYRSVSLDWHVAGVGDFNGDGRDDILWRNDDGRVTDWLGTAAGGYSPNAANFLSSLTLDWQIAAIGDYNGDGRDDILLRNNDGRTIDWLGTANGSLIDNAANSLNAVDPQWHVQPPAHLL